MSAKAKAKEEHLPIIRVGQFVTLNPKSKNKSIPKNLLGQQAVVTYAQIEQRPGGDDHSPRPYEYQAPDAVFEVKARDTRETVSNLTRDDFSEVAVYGRTELTGSG